MIHQLGIMSALVVFMAVFFVAGSDAADKVRISVSSLDTAFLTPAVALKRGFFKEEDIDAEVIRMFLAVVRLCSPQAECGLDPRLR